MTEVCCPRVEMKCDWYHITLFVSYVFISCSTTVTHYGDHAAERVGGIHYYGMYGSQSLQKRKPQYLVIAFAARIHDCSTMQRRASG